MRKKGFSCFKTVLCTAVRKCFPRSCKKEQSTRAKRQKPFLVFRPNQSAVALPLPFLIRQQANWPRNILAKCANLWRMRKLSNLFRDLKPFRDRQGSSCWDGLGLGRLTDRPSDRSKRSEQPPEKSMSSIDRISRLPAPNEF